jgi:hypothetical protein
MFPQRHSCDRCRQQKVRCLKNWELPGVSGGGHGGGGGGGSGGGNERLSPCERCAKADVPCVYSCMSLRPLFP